MMYCQVSADGFLVDRKVSRRILWTMEGRWPTSGEIRARVRVSDGIFLIHQ